MSTPHDRDRPDDDGTWQEPAHLGGDEATPDGPNIADRRMHPRDDQQPDAAAPWQPPGWDLPPAQRPDPVVDRTPEAEPDLDTPPGRPVPEDPRAAGGAPPPGLFGRSANRPPNEFQQTFGYQGDHVGVQAWAVQHGWTVSDGTAPEDAPLAELIASAPASRISKDHRAAGVLRGRADALDLVAFDVVYADRRGLIPQYAVTAAPLLLPVPYFRLSPARFWRHRVGALVQLPTGDPDFDRRWVLATAEDTPEVRRLAADPTVRALLLNTDDGDEFWAAAGHIAAIRPDGHRPELLVHHARLLTAVVRAVAGGG
jgi:hypothetical protein